MKSILFLLILTLSFIAYGDTVRKWVDEKGVVHYSDGEAAENIKGAETLKLENTFDQEAYEEGIKRHEETEKFAEEYEKERLKEEEEREKIEQETVKPMAPATGGTSVAPDRNRPIQIKSLVPGNSIGNRPVTLPAKPQ
jgi:hypothetical protein